VVNPGESERITRRLRIDPKLRAAGWHPIEFVAPRAAAPVAIEEFETPNGPADYALAADGRVVGVVEAKKLTLGPQGVLVQAERYSRGIDQTPLFQGEFGVPFLYATNGEVLWFHDVRHPLNRSRPVSGFHTPSALTELLRRDFDAELNALAAIPPNARLRPYQHEATDAIEEAIRARRRKMLVTMATGTGKTLMTVSEVYRLMKSGVARRVLFLVDRRALAALTGPRFLVHLL
jgi:type I restriction enzyme R subunit